MDILLIGNGFDLAHGLSTKYVDFLDFIMQITSHNLSKSIVDDFLNISKNNFWSNYFLRILTGADSMLTALNYTVQKYRP